MYCCKKSVAAMCLLFWVAGCTTALCDDMPMKFPGQKWDKGTPESQGVDAMHLQSALDYIEGHCKDDRLTEVMVIRNGVCIWDGGNTAHVHNIWSCSKSFTSTALGLMIAEGKCTLDTKAASIEPLLANDYPNVTLRHFTTMTSGYSAKGRSRWEDENADWSWTPYVPEAPLFEAGKGYAYWDEAMMMLGRVLTKLNQRELNDYLNEKVYQPIAMGDVQWLHEGEVDGVKICNGCTNVKLSARQLARFGHLFLNHGNWNGRQILPATWVEQATRTQVDAAMPVADTDRANVIGPGAYGYNWWTNGGKNRMPDAPPKTYYASGLNHNLLFIVPEWDMVIVRMGVDGNPPMGKPQAWNGFFKRLAGGVTVGQVNNATADQGRTPSSETTELPVTEFEISVRDVATAERWLKDQHVYGSDCEVAAVQKAGEGAFKVQTNREFSDLFFDMQKMVGHDLNLKDARFLSLRLMIPAGSRISAMKLNYKDSSGNLAGIPEVANDFYGREDRWVDYVVDLRDLVSKSQVWHGDADPIANVSRLSLNPFNADQSKVSKYYVSRISLSNTKPTGDHIDELVPRSIHSPNTQYHLDFDNPQLLQQLNAYRSFEASFQGLATNIAGNETMAVRVKGNPENKHIAFLPMLDRMTGSPVDFRNVKRIYFTYHVPPNSRPIHSSWLWLTSDSWSNILIDKTFHRNFETGGWHKVSVDIADLNLKRFAGDGPVLPNVDEIRLGFHNDQHSKAIEIWIDDFGWE